MNRTEKIILGLILLLFALMSCVGITWGLPSREIDKYLFGDGTPWSGEKIYRLAVADSDEKFSPGRGADVDVDPLEKLSNEPILLTGTDEDIAKIYLRYRLYTYQPDEMITMMALSGMRPSEFKFDPRLYQYGGLFIYPVGALIKLCGILGLIDVRSDIVYYLENPDEFGKFYIVARAYSALWGLIGILTVFAITRRLTNSRTSANSRTTGAMDKLRLSMNDSTIQHGQTSLSVAPEVYASDPITTSRAALLAALLFTLMPVVVCMAHEGKPHLPGAVLMLLAVYFAMRHLGIQYFTQSTTTTEPHASACAASVSSESPRGLKPAAQEPTQYTLPLTEGGLGGVKKHTYTSVGMAPTADWWLMCVCCGAAFGMVLSSGPIFILIPLVAYLSTITFPNRAAFPNRTAFPNRAREEAANHANASAGPAPNLLTAVKKTIVGTIIGFAVYFITNPYVLINAFTNREVLRSNFGNSFAMYEISRIGQGFVRVLELTVEGATLPVLILGAFALIVAIKQKRFSILPLAIPALLFFAQFVLIGAGKPAEYGRFGIFPNVALAIGASCLLTIPWIKLRKTVNIITGGIVVLGAGFFGFMYLQNFHADTNENNTRLNLSRYLSGTLYPDQSRIESRSIALQAEPAPYNCPPYRFSEGDVYLIKSIDDIPKVTPKGSTLYIKPIDRQIYSQSTFDPEFWGDTHLICETCRYYSKYQSSIMRYLSQTPISWANKPIELIGVHESATP